MYFYVFGFLFFGALQGVGGMPLSPVVCLVSTGVFDPIALAFRCEPSSESRRSNLINCSWIVLVVGVALVQALVLLALHTLLVFVVSVTLERQTVVFKFIRWMLDYIVDGQSISIFVLLLGVHKSERIQL